MSQSTRKLDISKILQVAESLENIVSRCFGPEGGQVLFIKSTGELLITKEGKRILESLLLDHPVARVIVNSASKHYSITGDGVKSFVLLLCAFIRELKRAANKNEDLILSGKSAVKNKSKCHMLKRMSSLLLTFQSTVLEPAIAECLSPHCHSLYSDAEGKVTLCRATLQQTLDAYFSGTIACNNQVFISRLACDYLYQCVISAEDILEVISLMDRCFFELLTEVPGFPVDNSRTLPGLVLHREFSVYCPAEGEQRALIVTDSIHQSLSAPGVAFVVFSDIQLRTSQQYLQQRMGHVMKQLQDNQIQLVLSRVKQHEIVLYYAKLYGISVIECLPSEVIDLLCTLTGVHPVSSPFTDDLLPNAFLATSCQPVLLGDRKHVQLVFSSTLAFSLHSLVLYGPVKGLTEQIASAVHGALKMLRWLFQPVGAAWEQPNNPDQCLPNTSVSVEEPSVTSRDCNGDCYPQRTGQDIQVACTDTEPNAPPKWTADENTLMHPQCTHASTGMANTCFNKLEATLQHRMEEESGLMLGKIPANLASSRQVPTSPNAALLLPAGGVFEMLLHHHLHERAKTYQGGELAVLCTVFGDALLCIPRHIYKDKTGKMCFPLLHSQYVKALNGKKATGIEQRGLESVSGKHQLMASVLHCVSKLVTIDLIVGVKRETGSEAKEEDTWLL
ncbi:Bardet-Biedl syndrome 10 protein [Hyperolius riggenbachi]|uniref:Bardet-Biedl syndrome 10 protein n=1 Tax=Hyperolius riggenbachi TaxID=752182 RepID=UPI0035A3304F